MRLEQREGRAVRLGSGHERIEVVRFMPPPALEAALRIDSHLRRKAALPGHAGLGEGGVRLWRWRSELADRLAAAGDDRTAGTAVIELGPPGALAGFELLGDGGGPRWSATVGWLDASGAWTESADTVTARLLAAADAPAGLHSDAVIRRALDALAPVLRARLSLATSRRWSGAEPEAEARRVAAALQARVREAARLRDRVALARLERTLAFVAGGHTAGEAAMLRRWDAEGLPPAAEMDRLPPPTARGEVTAVRLTGLVVFTGG